MQANGLYLKSTEEPVPSTYTTCPDCGTSVVNVQGVSACTDCPWIDPL